MLNGQELTPGRDKRIIFTSVSTPALGPTQLPEVNLREVKLAIRLHLMSRSKLVELCLYCSMCLNDVALN
jgi:hypothetical protein